MAPQFGASGLGGLVSDLTPALIANHVRAFAATCPIGSGLYVAHDLRDSSTQYCSGVLSAGRAAGLRVTECGAASAPALALTAMQGAPRPSLSLEAISQPTAMA